MKKIAAIIYFLALTAVSGCASSGLKREKPAIEPPNLKCPKGTYYTVISINGKWRAYCVKKIVSLKQSDPE